MKMKYLKFLILIISLIVVNPSFSFAKATVTGGPYSNLALTGQVVNLKLSGYPTGAGFYITQCTSVLNWLWEQIAVCCLFRLF